MKTVFGCSRRILRRATIVILIAALPAVATIIWSNHACNSAASGRIYRSMETVPERDVALVLGTAMKTARGNTNLHFSRRIETAAALFKAGKVRHILVSGDNHVAGYDEPSDMRDALISAGVPAEAITRDYAGFRTLDSIVRANSVFGLTRFTIVTEEFHCPRALWVARRRGLDAVAFAAPDLDARWTLKVKAREQLARAWCAVDLYLLNRQPKFAGPREPIQLTAAARQ